MRPTKVRNAKQLMQVTSGWLKRAHASVGDHFAQLINNNQDINEGVELRAPAPALSFLESTIPVPRHTYSKPAGRHTVLRNVTRLARALRWRSLWPRPQPLPPLAAGASCKAS